MTARRMLGIAATILCSTALTSCAEPDSAPDKPQPTTHMVVMEGMAFRPEVVIVKPGDTIVWANKDIVPHSATSAPAGFDSKLVPAGGSWRYRVEHTGEFDYVCAFHPTMTGKLKVQ